MIRTLNAYPDHAKAAEIMSRYRPIAPKPQTPGDLVNDDSSLSQKIKQSPFLRDLWPQLQARPTRSRKRGRPFFSPTSFKRQRTRLLGFCVPSHAAFPASHRSLQYYSTGLPLDQQSLPNLATVNITNSKPAVSELDFTRPGELNIMNLNVAVKAPEEKDCLLQLRGSAVTRVISPQPVRLIGSNISVGCIHEHHIPTQTLQAPKKQAELEQEVESEAFPVVISDSNQRVRMVNSAYKEMIGQPECPWLDSISALDGCQPGSSCKRISGEVGLHLGGSEVPISSNAFSCWVRIDWEAEGRKSSIHAFCNVVRLSCESRHYCFAWRFHTRSTDASQMSYNV